MSAVFVDSNILIYSQDATDSQKQSRALDWLEYLWRTRTGRISFPGPSPGLCKCHPESAKATSESTGTGSGFQHPAVEPSG